MADETKPIYVKAPPTFHSDIADKVVLRLNQSLYGLVQAPLYWGNHLRDTLVQQHGFTESATSPWCLYFCDGVIILTYVDDCLFFAKEQHQIDELLESI
jgi:hypothetical protein